MIKEEYKIIGVMSGTSLDGIDMAYVKLSKRNKRFVYEILNAVTIEYPKTWQTILKNLVNYSPEKISQIDIEYTEYLTYLILDFIDKYSIEEIDFVSSHGHTAFHEPDKKKTFQIGNLPSLANSLNNIVVCDFRIQDVELGGQGAPLVPIGDAYLFPEFQYCVNLGGFANLSTELNGSRIAYDICPLNIVLNHYVNRMGKPYDDEGKIACSGTINPKLLDSLNELEYYILSHPKSLGVEWVNQNFFPVVDAFELSTEDTLRTCVEHFATQITNQFRPYPTAEILFTGGGAHNLFLLNRIRDLTTASVIIPSKQLTEYKEALVFALLGALRIRNEINCLSSVTGAERNHSSGKIYLPKNNSL